MAVKEFINPTGGIGQVDVAAILNNALGNFAEDYHHYSVSWSHLLWYVISIFTCQRSFGS
jgi:hypothetical protein